jgi:hypothetical protein
MESSLRIPTVRQALASRPLRWLIIATVIVVSAERVFVGHPGLNATYFSGPGWQSGHEQARVVDTAPSTEALQQRRPDFAARPFSVEWRGYVYVRKGGTYRFAIDSDGGAALYVRGTVVVDSPMPRPRVPAEGSVTLGAGVHSVFLRYSHQPTVCSLDVRWGRNGDALEPVPPSAWLTERPSDTWVTLRQAAYIALFLVSLTWAGIVSLPPALWAIHLGRRYPLRAVVSLSILINACGIWWGLPNERGWAPDELVPIDVLEAFSQRFSHGWSSKYPPLHYAVLSLADSPLLLLSWLGHVDLQAPGPYLALFLTGRVLSVSLAAGMMIAVYLCGRELYGETGAVFATLTAALMAPIAYYGALTNLESPYLFWFMLALLAYLRVLKHHRRGDYLLFAACSALAVCTKDQAYGLVAGMALAIVVARWRRWRLVGGSPIQIVVDGTTILATGLAVAIFVVGNNLVFNYSGFVQHVKTLLGPASRDYQMFSGTVAGQLSMAAAASLELRYIFGWPLIVAAGIGVVWGFTRANRGSPILWLLVPPLFYYASFIGVVLYFYDRFLLPLGLVLALFAGGWLEQFVARGRRWRIVLVCAAFAYSLVYVALVDYSMVADSRYEITRWVKVRVRPGDVVASRGPLEYFMLANGFRTASTETIENIMSVRPAFIVLSSDAATLGSEGPFGAVHDALRAGWGGYLLGLRYQTPWVAWPGGHPDLSDSRRQFALSSLGGINPLMEVFVRPDVLERRPWDAKGDE